MKVKNVIVPVLVFLFSVVVFALCFLFLFFFHCLYFGDGFHHSWPTMIRTISWESQTGIPKIRPLKISSHLTKLRPNHEIILVWKARQDRKYRVMRREEGKERKRKTKNQCCTLCFYIVYFEDSVSTKTSAWPKKFIWKCMRNLNYLQASPLSFENSWKFLWHMLFMTNTLSLNNINIYNN